MPRLKSKILGNQEDSGNPLKGRRRKNVLGGHRTRLETPQISGYATRWVNDIRSKIHEKTVEDDWEFVLRSEIEQNGRVVVGDDDISNVLAPGEKVCKPVGKVGDMVNCNAYLLKKKKTWYEADYKAAQDKITERESQIKNPQIENQQGSLKIQ